MTENRSRPVEEPRGYDYPPTDRIPVPGDLSDSRPGDRPDMRPTDELVPEPAPPMDPPAAPVESTDIPVETDTPVESADTQEFAPEPATTGSDEAEREFFDNTAVDGFRDRWRELQSGFVDDPAQAVRGADDLVDEIMRELAERKEQLEDRWRDGPQGPAGTEELRVVIREYRAFFDRLLNA